MASARPNPADAPHTQARQTTVLCQLNSLVGSICGLPRITHSHSPDHLQYRQGLLSLTGTGP
jgi:hypothetical protein